MRTMLLVFALALTAATDAEMPRPSTDAADFAIRNVRMFDGERIVQHANVVVRGGLIVSVAPGAPIPSGMRTIDGADDTLLPGLIDAHVHVFPGAQEDALRFGVTTELDMFNMTHEFAAWRAQRQSLARTNAADTWSAGTGVSAPGGHPSGTMPGSSDIPTLASAGDADAFVRARAAEGSDYIKIILEDNSFLTPEHLIPALSQEEVCASVRAAHRIGKLAVVHVSRRRDAYVALQCGVDGLAHIFADAPADPAFIRLAKRRHVFIETTLGVVAAGSGMGLPADTYARPEVSAFLSPAQKRLLKFGFGPARPKGIDAALASAAALHTAGIPLLAGTDAPNPGAPHGAGLQVELRLLVMAGLRPVEALAAATSVPARTFHLPQRGRIAPGYRADLLLVRGDPSRDIEATLSIKGIWKNGFQVSRDGSRAMGRSTDHVSPV